MESLPIPDELLAEIFLRLPSPADLARVSAACVSFRRGAADRAFLRQYRKLHPAPLLGFLDYRGVFNPADPPHSSVPAARAAALAADFSFSFLPGLTADWEVQDVCGPLLRNIDVGIVLAELVVCDPLHRRCLMLPPIPADLAPSVEDPLWRTRCYCAFLASSEDDDEETSFSVIWMAECVKKVVAFVFSSSTGQWRAASSQSWSNLFDGMLSSTGHIRFHCRHYANGCFYWETALNENLLVLDTQRMEFSRADKPDEASGGAIDCINIGIVEAGEGGLGMFVRVHMTSDLTYYTLRQEIGGSSSKWHKEKTVSLGSRYTLVGSRGSYLFLHRLGSSALE
ncbi:hypothetical protein BRADI_3g01412v3 [Brachypodium distachyon]|uniref:Uncharacterized protein n=1 Tax=Brachypodium distachyon TaxID=15368 RepID=A0A2K2CUL3_BRADI|nr:hypothetical protein BRADI_3g01412v3 [Brachypodium distachyon]